MNKSPSPDVRADAMTDAAPEAPYRFCGAAVENNFGSLLGNVE